MTTGVCHSLYLALSLSEWQCWSHSFWPLVSIFMDQELILYGYSFCCCCCSCCFYCLGDAVQKILSSVVSNRVGTNFCLDCFSHFEDGGHSVLSHRQFLPPRKWNICVDWRSWIFNYLCASHIWPNTFMMMAMTSFHTENCWHLVSAHAASTQCICSSVCQLPISTCVRSSWSIVHLYSLFISTFIAHNSPEISTSDGTMMCS